MKQQWLQAWVRSARGASCCQALTADVLLPHWVAGKDAAMDVTIVTPLQTATMPGAANTAGHEQRRSVGGRGLLSFPSSPKPLAVGTPEQRGR